MTWNRREFIGTALVATLPLAAAASPVPVPRVRGKTLALPSDTPPPLPEGAIARLGSRRFRTGKSISRIQFDPTGTVIVAADRDEIRGWETATAKPIFSMPYPEKVDLNSGRISSISTIVTLGRVNGGNQYEIHHYHFATGRTDITAKTSLASIDNAAFTADGSHVAAQTQGRVCVLDGKTGRELWNATATGEMLFFPGSGTLLVSGADGANLYEVPTGKLKLTLETDKAPPKKKGRGNTAAAIRGAVVSANGLWIAATYSSDRTQVILWKATEAKPVHTLKCGTNASPLGFTADATELIVEHEGALVYYSVMTGKTTRTVDIGANASVTLSPDGQFVATMNEDAVVLFEAATGKLAAHSADPPGLPNHLEYLNANILRGTLTAFGGWVDWKLDSSHRELIRVPTVGAFIPVGLAADRRTVLMHHDGKMNVWDMAVGTVARTLKVESNRSTPLAGLTRDGRTLLMASDAGLSIWDALTGAKMAIAAAGGVRAVTDQFAVSSDGNHAASAGHIDVAGEYANHSYLEIYSRTASQMLHRIGFPGHILQLQFSPDGTHLLVLNLLGEPRRGNGANAEGHYVYFYHCATGRRVAQLVLSTVHARVTAISPDNRTVLTGNDENAIEVWELLSGRKRMTLTNKGSVSAIAVAPDGGTFASAGAGGPVLLWDLRCRRRNAPSKPDAKGVDALCERLADPDAVAALTAIRTIAAWPESTLPALAAKIEPVKGPDALKLKKWIDDLDAPAFRDRDKAMRELHTLGDLAMPALTAALASTGSDEVRQRASDLLEMLATAKPTDLRSLRAVEAAEWAGGDAAKKVLTAWAGGASAARLTIEAKAALKRMR